MINDKSSVHSNTNIRILLKSNNFDLLRFCFAFIVVLVHTYVLTGNTKLLILSNYLSSEIAVKSFFVVSGFLIFMSYENSESVKVYLAKRARRIYPAYFFIVLSCSMLGAIFSSHHWDYYFFTSVLKYITANLFFLNFLHPTLPGLFEGNPIQAINGALWTLKVEVMFYLIVPLIVAAFIRFGRLKVLLITYALSVSYSLLMSELDRYSGSTIYAELQRQLPGQLRFFLAGAACYYYLEYFSRYRMILLASAVTAFVLQAWLPWVIIQPAALSILIVYLACFLPLIFNFSKFGDFSYGIYILHFPILQFLIVSNVFNNSPWQLVIVTILIVIGLAFLLWHFIEKPFLRKSSHYIVNS